MGKSLFGRIQAKLELFRLENRYTRRRHRRSTFVSNAVYVDGEYVYQTPSTTGSSMESTGTNGSQMSRDSHGPNALHGERAVPAVRPVEVNENGLTPSQQRAADRAAEIERERERERKRMHRFSSIPQFGGSYSPYSSNTGMPTVQDRRASYMR